jgi:hypothetical protein
MPLNPKEIAFHCGDALEIPPGFNPGQILFKVYYRIFTPQYGSNENKGFSNTFEKRRFYESVKDFVEPLGFKLEENNPPGYAMLSDHEVLNILPDHLYGFLTMDNLEFVHKAFIRDDCLLPHRWTDVYDAHEVINVDELNQRIERSRDDLTARIFNMLKTKAPGVYRPSKSLSFEQLESSPGFRLVGESLSTVWIDALRGIFDGMTRSGLLRRIDDRGETFYRAATRAELKRLSLKEPVAPAQLSLVSYYP